MKKKKTAVVLFPYFCNFEIAVLLSKLQMENKPVVYIGASQEIYRCEEGIQTIVDKTYDECDFNEFDSLVITGSYAKGQYILFKDEKLHKIIREFNEDKKLIAAISSGPMTLCKAGIMKNRKFIAGVEKKWYLEDENIKLKEEDMEGLIGYKDVEKMIKEPDFMLDENILTALGYKYVEWANEFIRIIK
ncbi:DJ-1/PfpI family protein [Miniphocaeibacter halophilus]|uniref:DJ-1/PfpI family protein n=1 Tax=Miniphocaeibacter halophilus TaxID=2931922 RepID=A0AC61MRT9_9FIRM|nr:DJ-1/PfpI family protein [Miniphocaeibacter halophilus]QQK08275.1 DJ-1/PfpI family protein [Miniphocaeibacter halophilus]